MMYCLPVHVLLQEAQQSLVVYEQQYKEYEEQDQALRRDDNTLRQEKVHVLCGVCFYQNLLIEAVATCEYMYTLMIIFTIRVW